MMHFAYGSNMSRTLMRRHAPTARPVGVASLGGYRFVITRDGYASVEPSRGDRVHGLLWRLAARDRVTLDIWENVAKGLYRPEWLPVETGSGRCCALVYVARAGALGRARPGYVEVVIAAAREWRMPEPYIRSLERWRRPDAAGNPAMFKGPSHKTGDFG